MIYNINYKINYSLSTINKFIKNYKLVALVLTLLFSSTKAMATVNTYTGNFELDYKEFTLGQKFIDPYMGFQYHSRTLHDGLFGFGWITPYETNLEILPESKIRVTDWGGGDEKYFYDNTYNPKNLAYIISAIMIKAKKTNANLSKKYFRGLEADLWKNTFLRESLAQQFNLVGKIKIGKVYFAEGDGFEYLVFDGKKYKRRNSLGEIQYFNLDGKLVERRGSGGIKEKLTYMGDRLVKIKTNLNKIIELDYYANGKVKTLAVPGKGKVYFQYSNDDLYTINYGQEKKIFKYDDQHNLINHLNNKDTVLTLDYDKNLDLVQLEKTKFCTNKFQYGQKQSRTAEKFTVNAFLNCNGKSESKFYSYLYKLSKKVGQRVLASSSVKDGKNTKYSYYDGIYGRKIREIVNNNKIEYLYNKYGLLENRVQANHIENFVYENKCFRPSKYKKTKKNSRIPTSIQTIRYEYTPKICQLKTIVESSGTKFDLNYDFNGRLVGIYENNKETMQLKYLNSSIKPNIIFHKSFGELKINYDSNGNMQVNFVGTKNPKQIALYFQKVMTALEPAVY